MKWIYSIGVLFSVVLFGCSSTREFTKDELMVNRTLGIYCPIHDKTYAFEAKVKRCFCGDLHIEIGAIFSTRKTCLPYLVLGTKSAKDQFYVSSSHLWLIRNGALTLFREACAKNTALCSLGTIKTPKKEKLDDSLQLHVFGETLFKGKKTARRYPGPFQYLYKIVYLKNVQKAMVPLRIMTTLLTEALYNDHVSVAERTFVKKRLDDYNKRLFILRVLEERTLFELERLHVVPKDEHGHREERW